MAGVYNWAYLVLAEGPDLGLIQARGRRAVAGDWCSIYGSQGPIVPPLSSVGKDSNFGVNSEDFMQEISLDSVRHKTKKHVAKPQQYGQHEQLEWQNMERGEPWDNTT